MEIEKLMKTSKMPITPQLSIVVPCYNEESVLLETAKRISNLLNDLQEKKKVAPQSMVWFVDDGSQDRTWQLIEELSKTHTNVRGIRLSRNRGHQNALLAGLLNACGDVLVSVDADLQDDLTAIEQMLDAYQLGHDIVYGVRKCRNSDTFFKRFTAEGYYRILAKMGVDIVFNHADYRLMSRRTIEALRCYQEVNLFLRGIIPQMGYPSTNVFYDRAERFAGESKYPFRKMLAFGWQGITSFSTAPLRMITGLGLLISFGSFIITMWAVYVKLFSNLTVPGWTSTVVPIYLLGGIQLLCIGIIGEYLAKIYMETKRRPPFFIDKII